LNSATLTVKLGEVKQQEHYVCILSGRMGQLVPVALRRMFILGPLWHGKYAVVTLPLESPPMLVPWQYLRMLRPYIVFAVIICCFLTLGSLDVRPGSVEAFGLLLCTPIIAVCVWILLGRLLNRFEFVRLITFNKSAGTVSIRFSSDKLAERARSVLIEVF
jgi:hypothetical protein